MAQAAASLFVDEMAAWAIGAEADVMEGVEELHPVLGAQ